MTPDLTDDDKAILGELLRETIERDRFPLSPRVRSFKAILAKLDPRGPLRIEMSKRGHDDAGARPRRAILRRRSRRASAAWC